MPDVSNTVAFLVDRLNDADALTLAELDGLLVEPYPNDPATYQAKADRIVLVQFTGSEYAGRIDSFELHIMVRAEGRAAAPYQALLNDLTSYVRARLQYYQTPEYTCIIGASKLEGYSENTGMWVMTLTAGIQNFGY